MKDTKLKEIKEFLKGKGYKFKKALKATRKNNIKKYNYIVYKDGMFELSIEYIVAGDYEFYHDTHVDKLNRDIYIKEMF